MNKQVQGICMLIVCDVTDHGMDVIGSVFTWLLTYLLWK
jgi:hypothetical protein